VCSYQKKIAPFKKKLHYKRKNINNKESRVNIFSKLKEEQTLLLFVSRYLSLLLPVL